MTKFIKYTLKTFGIIFGILLILYVVAFIYLSINKKKIIQQVTVEVGKKINGNVSIGDVELSFFRTFPNASVLLHNVLITDTMFAKHHHAFFKGEEVYAQLSIINLIKKESPVNGFRIEKAAIYLFTDTSGYSNMYLLKPKNATASTGGSTHENSILKSIELKNVRFTLDDRKREKLHDIVVNELKIKMKDEDVTTFFSAKANMFVHSLAFNLPMGSFIKEKSFEGNFDFNFNKKLSLLRFDSININIGDHPFNVSGRFDLIGPNPQFILRVHTKKILYDFARKLLTKKIDTALSIVDLDKPVDADVALSGPLNGGDPLIYANWAVEKSHLTTPFVDFDDASLTGYYVDEVVPGLPRRDPNSKIGINNFTATWNGLPISSKKMEILNLFQPVLTCDISSNFPLTKLNDLIGSNSIQLESGNGLVNLTYKGPIEKNNNENSFINGEISFTDGNILYAPRDVELKNVNGKMVFKNSDLLIENLQCNVLNNKIVMDGKANNLLTLINTEPNKVNLDFNIYSPALNLSAFTYLLKSSKKASSNSSQKGKFAKLASNIDDVLDRGSVHLNLRTPRLTYKKLEANNATASITLLQDRYIINNVSMDQAGGHITLNGSLLFLKDNYHEIKANAILDRVDVARVFKAFNNFGQDGIQAKNLDGKLSAKVNATLAVDDEGKAYPNSIVSVVDFSLKNGGLNDFEPIKKIQSFIFKKRDFDNIRFAELKDRLEIANQEIKINKMEIESNVLSMYVEGIYSMKGSTNMSIQIPLSNLKKRDADYKPENLGLNKKAGASIYLRGRPGSDGSIQFKPELLHLFRKSKFASADDNK